MTNDNGLQPPTTEPSDAAADSRAGADDPSTDAVLKEALARIREKSHVSTAGGIQARAISKEEFIGIVRDYIRDEIETLVTSTTAFKTEVSNAARDNLRIIDGLNEKIAALENSLNDALASKQELQSRIDSLISDTEALKDAAQSAATAGATATALQSDVDTYKSKIADVESRLAAAEANLEAARAAAEANLESAQKAATDQAAASAADTASEIKRLQSELDELRQSSLQNTETMARTEAEIETLRAALDDCKAKRASMIEPSAFEAIKSEYEAYKAAQASAVMGGVEPSIHAQVVSERDGLKSRVDALEKELGIMMESITQQLAQLGDSQSLRGDLARLEAELANARGRIADLERVIADQKAMIDKQSVRIADMEAQLVAARADADRIRADFSAKLDALEARKDAEKKTALEEQQILFKEQVENARLSHQAELERLQQTHKAALKETTDKLDLSYKTIREKESQIQTLSSSEDDKSVKLRKQIDALEKALAEEKIAHEKTVKKYEEQLGVLGVAIDLFEMIESEPDFDAMGAILDKALASNPLLPELKGFLAADKASYQKAMDLMLKGKLDVIEWIDLKTALAGIERIQRLAA
ncbi:MAG: hypothetical protein ABIH86_01420 [Planctomycetota bacterium]